MPVPDSTHSDARRGHQAGGADELITLQLAEDTLLVHAEVGAADAAELAVGLERAHRRSDPVGAEL